MKPSDGRFMSKALALAAAGRGFSSPNPTVGCVIVQEGKIIGMGSHDYGRMDHAEIVALRNAGLRALGATAYVSLEPCCHHGRTPPCAEALIKAGIARVVAAIQDPNPRISGRGLECLRTAGVQVECGLLREPAEALIEDFACHVNTGRPLVTAKVGMSLDGRIGTRPGNDRKITSEPAAEFVQSLRHQSDAILVGIGTVLADDPELTYRGAMRRRRGLIRVILDSQLRTPQGARIFRASPASPLVIFCRPDAARKRREQLERQGAEVVPVRTLRGRLDLARILGELGRRGVLGLLVEGGSEVHWSFLDRRLVDKFYFIVAPLVLGGRDSVPAVGGTGYRLIRNAPRFKIRRQITAGPDLILETYPAYSRSIVSPWLP